MLSKIVSTQAKYSFLATRSQNFSVWGKVEAAPADPILGLNEAFKKETNSKKVLLGVGAYRDDNGKPYTLSCVKKATQIINDKNMDHEYAGIEGIASYVDKSIKLAYGDDSQHYKDGRIAAAQSISGTGAIRLGLEFLAQHYPKKDATIYIPDQTWPVHRTVAAKTGFKWENYRYYQPKTKSLEITGLLEDFDKAPSESIFMVHVCAHNPTGVDPKPEQWQQILEVVKRKNHFICFDSAYQGFASGDLNKDAYALRLFQKEHDRIMLFQSFAKNFGLYGERAGAMSIVTGSKQEQEIVMSRIKQLARMLYSNPPIHGARIVDIILSDKGLTQEWYDELKVMSGRIADMRKSLVEKLKEKKNPHDWRHITDQIGMFAFTGLNKEMVEELRRDYAIYMTADGRISLAGLNTKNVEYVADAFHKVTKDKKF